MRIANYVSPAHPGRFPNEQGLRNSHKQAYDLTECAPGTVLPLIRLLACVKVSITSHVKDQNIDRSVHYLYICVLNIITLEV